MNKNILIINNGTNLLSKLVELMERYGRVTIADVVDLNNINFGSFDLIILSGSSTYGIKDLSEVYSTELNFISNTSIPLIGICIGFELICQAFGADFNKLDSKDLSIRKIKYRDKFYLVKEAHSYSVISVNEELNVLATSENGIEIVKHTYKPIIGVQFHPESMTQELEGDELFDFLIKDLIF